MNLNGGGNRDSGGGVGGGGHRRNSSSPPHLTRSKGETGGEGGAAGGGQEWCLHAQLTISHPKSEPLRTTYVARGIGVGGGASAPKDKWTTTGSNVQFQYSWSNCDKETLTQVVPDESGIQKFESWPRRTSAGGGAGGGTGGGGGISSRVVFGDSGYSTEQNFGGAGKATPSSAQSQPNTSFKARVIQPYGRRCISTCTITLSNDPNALSGDGDVFGPSSKYSFSSENLSKDWNTFPKMSPPQAAPVPTPPPPPTRIVVKDAETQTNPPPPPTSILARTSPSYHTHTKNDFTSITVNPDTSNVTVLNNNARKESPSSVVGGSRQSRGHHQKKESVNKSVQIRSQSPPKHQHHSSRPSFKIPPNSTTTGAGTSAAIRRAKSSPPIRYQQKTNQPRTVHIDVYCTGSEEMSTTSTDGEGDGDNLSSAGTSSTPQTVYNTTQYKIQHQKHKTGYPHHYPALPEDLRNNTLKSQQQQKIPTLGEMEEVDQPSGRNTNGNTSNLNNIKRQSSPSLASSNFLQLRKNLSGESCETGSLLSTTYPGSSRASVNLGGGGDDRLSRGSTASSFSYFGGDQQSDVPSSWKESKAEGDAGEDYSASYRFDGKRLAHVGSGGTEGENNLDDLEENLLQGGVGGNNDQWWLQYLFSKFDTKGINMIFFKYTTLSKLVEEKLKIVFCFIKQRMKEILLLGELDLQIY